MGGGSQTQTTESSPWAGAAPYLEGILSDAQQLYENAPGYTGLNQQQLDALQGAQNYLNTGLGGTNQAAQNTWASLMRSPEEIVASAPVQNMITQNTQNVTDQLLRDVLPGIRSGSAMAGQYGSTRQGVAEGLATGEAADAAQNYATNLVGNLYQNQAANQLGALGYTGALQDSLAAENQGLFDIGSILRGEEQEMQNYDWNQLQNLFNFVLPAAGTGGTTVSTGPGQSLFNQLAGAGLAGAGIYSGFWGGA